MMVALNFQAQFVNSVESGEKSQTIRRPRKHPIVPGCELQLYAGMRTKACRKLADAVCLSVDSFTIDESGEMWVDGYLVPDDGFRDGFAKADGFSNAAEMTAWFERTYGLPFDGVLIRWVLQ